MRARHLLLAAAAGVALADASIVTLALPDLLRALDTTVEGVASVIAVYTIVLAIALVPAERLARRHGPARVGAAGLALMAAASVVCAAAGSLVVLDVARGIQALGGAVGLIAAFELLAGRQAGAPRLWTAAAVLSTAVGPAVGGALTQAFDWRAIFVFQAPVALLAAVACARSSADDAALTSGGPRAAAPGGPGVPTSPGPVALAPSERVGAARWPLAPTLALALVSAALSAVLFLLVLLLVAGWSEQPLEAALFVTVIPVAAVAGSRISGPPLARAVAGCALAGGGVLALAWLPDAHLAWTVVPQALAGLGLGLALPALAGELLPERDAADAAHLLTIRHAGIAVALIALAPVVAHNLDAATHRAKERGVALVLDAPLPPQAKLRLAPGLLAGVNSQRPRAGLRQALDEHRADVTGSDAAAYETLAKHADATLVTAVGEAFRAAFVVTGALGFLAALALLLGAGATLAAGAVAPVAAAAALAVAAPVAYAAAHHAVAPEPVTIADPCKPRPLPQGGGITGLLQNDALKLLDRAACRYGSSREELVLALADEGERKRFVERHRVDPRTVGGILQGLFG